MSTPLDEQLARVGRTLEAIDRRLGRAEQLASSAKLSADTANRNVEPVRHALDALVAQVEALANHGSVDLDEAATDGPQSWFDIDDPDTARHQLAELAGWLEQVYVHYPKATLPDCWPWHPWVIEELRALRLAWLSAYDPGAASLAPQRIADWHDRLRPGVVRRIQEGLSGCWIGRHVQDGRDDRAPVIPPPVPATERLDDLAGWWADTGGRSAPPPPTANDLAIARGRVRP